MPHHATHEKYKVGLPVKVKNTQLKIAPNIHVLIFIPWKKRCSVEKRERGVDDKVTTRKCGNSFQLSVTEAARS